MTANPVSERAFIPLEIAVLVVSDSRTEKTDKSGKLLVSRLQESGHRLADKTIVPDDVYRIRAQVAAWIAHEKIQVVVSTGGTGVTGSRRYTGSHRTAAGQADRRLRRNIPGRCRSRRLAPPPCSRARRPALPTAPTYSVCRARPGPVARPGNKLIHDQLDYRTRPCNLVELLPRLLET